MYAIRVDSERHVLLITVGARLTTAEALRAASQAFSLADAVGIRAVCCNISALERGPGGSLVVAATIAARFAPPMRIALVGGPWQARSARRLIRFSGIQRGMRFFTETMDAEVWLVPAMTHSRPRLSLTERHHLQEALPAPARANSKRTNSAA